MRNLSKHMLRVLVLSVFVFFVAGGIFLLLLHLRIVSTQVLEKAEVLGTKHALWWDRKAPLFPQTPWDGECAFFVTKPHTCVSSFKMCLRNPIEQDYISDTIRKSGRWPDCDSLPKLWDHDGIFLDIGGNIGSCSLLMLAFGARVVAFEPVPHNLYYFTRSVLANPVEFRERLTLYPFALSNSTGVHSIFLEPKNAGNAVIDKPIHARREMELKIQVLRLDDVLWQDAASPPPKISVLKIDAQGLEVKILDGAKRLLAARAIRCVKAEIATDWLIGQGTSPSEYCSVLMSSGFNLHTENNEMVTPGHCAAWDKSSVILDVIGCLR